MKSLNLTQLIVIPLISLLSPALAADPAQTATPETGRANRAVTLAPLGDSRTAIISFDTAGLNLTTLSHLNWANALNQQKYPYTGNFGISGADSGKIISTMLKPALASHPTFMTILMGVNDVRVPGFSAEHTMANIAQAADKALAQGITPIVFTDPGAVHYAAAQVTFINDLNARIKDYCAATKGAVLFDMAALISTQRTPLIVFQPGWSYDGVHLQTLGAYKVGLAFAALMDTLGAAAPAYPGLSGNLLANPGFSGTGGTVGEGNTGALPDSFAGSRDNANCAAAFSVNARADGTSEVVAALTANESNKLAGMRVTQMIPVTDVVPGDGFQAGVQVDIDAGSVNLADVRAEVSFVFSDGSFAIVYDFDGTSKRDTISSITGAKVLSLTLQSPINSYPADKQIKSIKFTLGARMMGQGNATLRFRNPWCKKFPQSEAGK